MTLPVLALVGPTASGKTDMAVRLAANYPIEVVSMDSALVYQDMDIGTAKPDDQTLHLVPHHLIDLITPEESYSAARYRDEALEIIRQIKARNHVPLLVGGTMLYYKVLLEGLDELPSADDSLRNQIEMQARDEGWPAMHEQLRQVDPVAADKIEPTDAQRIQRALEVYLATGRPISSFWGGDKATNRDNLFHTLAMIPVERVHLHRRIEARFDAMLQAGLVDELAGLRSKYQLEASLPSMRCVGYRQAWNYLEGGCSKQEMRDQGVYATRQLAKRQLTWLRGMELDWVDCFDEKLHVKINDWARKALAA